MNDFETEELGFYFDSSSSSFKLCEIEFCYYFCSTENIDTIYLKDTLFANTATPDCDSNPECASSRGQGNNEDIIPYYACDNIYCSGEKQMCSENPAASGSSGIDCQANSNKKLLFSTNQCMLLRAPSFFGDITWTENTGVIEASFSAWDCTSMIGTCDAGNSLVPLTGIDEVNRTYTINEGSVALLFSSFFLYPSLFLFSFSELT